MTLRQAHRFPRWFGRHRTGEHDLQVGAELVGHRDPVGDEILAGAAGLPQRDGRRAVRDQRREPGPVGAQRVGQDERVEPLVLVARPTLTVTTRPSCPMP
jgi:hypothetical protein